MTELLQTVDIYLWIVGCILLTIYFMLWVKGQKISSTFIALTITALIGGISVQYQSFLLGIKAEEHEDLVRFAWYIGFATMDIIVILVLRQIHLLTKTPYSFITKTMFLAHLVLGIMQVVRYGERYFFNTDYLKPIYKSGIVAINVSVTGVTIIFTIIILISKYREARGKEGVTWWV